MSVKPRFTDFGDGAISDWHRSLGDEMPAVDLDKVLIEYDRGRPKAVIDYKHVNSKNVDWVSPSFSAMRELCSARTYEIPLMVVRFDDRLTEFAVQPVNLTASAILSGNPRRKMTEQQYKIFLETVRQTKRG